jgi:Na+/H+-dicarboxylate symporter
LKNESVRVIGALVLAIVAGVLISWSANASLLRGADALATVGLLWVNAIRMTVIPLVVSLVITSIASVSDVSAIGRLGGRTLLVFFALVAGVALIAMPLIPAVFALLPHLGTPPPLPAGASDAARLVATSGDAPTVASFLLSLVPANPVAAAANGAMLPLLVFSVLFGLAAMRIAATTRASLLGFLHAVADTMLVLVRWVVLVAPIGIFALVLPLAAHAGSSLVGGIGFYIAVYSIVSVVMTLALYPAAAIFGRMSIARFARAALAPQLIAFSSSSSVASLPALIKSAEEDLGLPKRVTGFVLPMAVSMFKIAGPVSWTVGALFVGWFYGVPLHARELATIAFAAVFLTAAAPGVPRGAFIMLTPLLVAVGLPAEGVGILIAVDGIPDTFATVLNVTGDLAAAAITAGGRKD